MSKFTKQAIIDTFIKMLEVKSLDKITVKELVKECGINRNTFYYYYKDIYDLLEDIFIQESSRIISENRDDKFFYLIGLKVHLQKLYYTVEKFH